MYYKLCSYIYLVARKTPLVFVVHSLGKPLLEMCFFQIKYLLFRQFIHTHKVFNLQLYYDFLQHVVSASVLSRQNNISY